MVLSKYQQKVTKNFKSVIKKNLSIHKICRTVHHISSPPIFKVPCSVSAIIQYLVFHWVQVCQSLPCCTVLPLHSFRTGICTPLYTTVCLEIDRMLDLWIVSRLKLLRIMLLCQSCAHGFYFASSFT